MRAITVTALLCTLLLSANADISPVAKNSATSVLVNNEFYTLSVNGQSVRLNKGNETILDKNLAAENFYMSSDIRASSDDGVHIIFWGVKSYSTATFGKLTINHVFGIINVQTKHMHATIHRPDTIEAQQPVEARVLTYKDTFDIVLPSQEKCNPCTYSVHGKLLNEKSSFPRINLSGGFHLGQFLSDGRRIGYVFAANTPKQQSSVIYMIAEGSFQVKKQKSYQHRIDQLVTNFMQRGNVAICYERTVNEHDIRCETLNDNLEAASYHVVPINAGYTLHPILAVDTDGSFFMLVTYERQYPVNGKYTMQQETYRIGYYRTEITRVSNHRELLVKPMSTQSFLVGIEKYCVVNVIEKFGKVDTIVDCRSIRELLPITY